MTRVKICGITNTDDAFAAAEAGADLLGFVFYPPSPRYVTPDHAEELICATRLLSPRIQTVGVFVNESVARVAATVKQCQLDLVQMHGTETPAQLAELSGRAYKSIRPVDMHGALALLDTYHFALDGSIPAFIVDAFSPTLFGGTGERGDWAIARTIASRFPILLAGGLAPQNVAEAVAQVQPWGVDVSSGVERAPGLKDHSKLKRFIDRVRDQVGALW